MWSRVFAKYSLVVNFMSCNTVKTCACLIQGKIFGGIIEIYHACTWYLPNNTGFETRQISLAYRLGKFVLSLNQYFFWQIPLTSMVYVCKIKSHMKWKYLIQKFHDICLSYYFRISYAHIIVVITKLKSQNLIYHSSHTKRHFNIEKSSRWNITVVSTLQ